MNECSEIFRWVKTFKDLKFFKDSGQVKTLEIGLNIIVNNLRIITQDEITRSEYQQSVWNFNIMNAEFSHQNFWEIITTGRGHTNYCSNWPKHVKPTITRIGLVHTRGKCVYVTVLAALDERTMHYEELTNIENYYWLSSF